jgi:hypothetical protein
MQWGHALGSLIGRLLGAGRNPAQVALTGGRYEDRLLRPSDFGAARESPATAKRHG